MKAGANHTCGLTSAGDMVCWGSNQFGQLGLSDAPWSNVMVPVPRPEE
jgi:alpha-tubulin suppressor-like RCC1 family protein